MKYKGVMLMIDIQVQKTQLIEVIEDIIQDKVKVKNSDACEVLATEIVNGLEELNSEETQANNLLGLNSELRHEVNNPSIAKKLILTANEDSRNNKEANKDMISN